MKSNDQAIGGTSRFGRPEVYCEALENEIVIRTVRDRKGNDHHSTVPILPTKKKHQDPGALFDYCWLRATELPKIERQIRKTVRIADMFSGCGMMTLGAYEACRALGYRATAALAIDSNDRAAATYKLNFPEAMVVTQPIEKIIDGSIGQRATSSERGFLKSVGKIDLMLGGPPCQGHSDLNNHTRRSDPKNALLLTMVRAAELFDPEHVVIENVRGIKHDQGRVVDKAMESLQKLGYCLNSGVLKAEDFGVAQQRHRFFLVASKGRSPIELDALGARYGVATRDFAWAADDLTQIGSSVFDTPSTPSPDNSKRMAYLFSRGLYDLPNSKRPNCHRLNNHSYKSVYGRMHWDRPSQTITTGYGSMGQGRFVHPKYARTITPHEASRLQFIPDFYIFDEQRRGALAEMIGNAVPPKLTYVTVLEALR